MQDEELHLQGDGGQGEEAKQVDRSGVATTEVTRPEISPLWQQYERELLELCGAKAEEFHLLGYEEVTASEVWQCVLSITKGRGRLHEMVGAVLGLNAGKFMSYTTINAYQGIFHEQDAAFDAPNRA